MLHILKIDDYLKILTDEAVKDFVAINFSGDLKSMREKQNHKNVARLLYIFLTTPDEVEKYVHSSYCNNYIRCYNVEIFNIFDPELQPIN